MTTKIQQIIDKLTSNLKTLFLIDAVGALLTAFSLGIILVKFEEYFGMPQSVLFSLSLVACFFMAYSFCCYFFIASNRRPYLKAIAIANMMYCCLTLGLVFYFYQSLTILGLTYFLLEVMVISVLIFIELKAS